MLIAPVHTLIFDLDNTMIDRNEAMRKGIGDWLLTQGWSELQSKAALNDIMKKDDWGYASRPAFCNWLLLTYGNEQSRNLSPQQMLDILLKNVIRHIYPDSSVSQCLQKGSGYFRLVLATNGGSITQRAKLKQAQLLAFFKPKSIFISQEVGFDKPDKRFYETIIESLQLEPADAMVIGDNPVNDIQAAAACDLLTCWVSHGREQLKQIRPNYVIKDITAINQWSQSQISRKS